MPDAPCYQRAPGCAWRRWQGSVLVMGPDREPIQLDGAAALLWQHLGSAASLDQVLVASESAWVDAPGEPLDLLSEAAAALVELGVVQEERS